VDWLDDRVRLRRQEPIHEVKAGDRLPDAGEGDYLNSGMAFS
jgi:hypothetical protein